MNLNKHLYQKHCNCKVKVTYNYVPKKSKSKSDSILNRPALICVNHNRWIKWLSADEAQAIEDLQ